ncbi:MAG: glycosyltransferase, partial [bacterium]
MPKVTIGIPTYNSQKFIEQAINSVLSQTYQDFELIICDDLSSDNTDEIINIYLEKDKRIRYFKNPEHIGLFENFNQCIKHSS